MSLKAKIEAVIYASEEPVTLAQLAGLLGHEAQAELDHLDSAQHSLTLGEGGDQAADQPLDHDALNDEVLAGADELEAEPSEEERHEALDHALHEAAVEEAHEAAVRAHHAAADNAAMSSADAPSAELVLTETPVAETPVAGEKADDKKAAREEKARAQRLRDYFRELLDQLIADYARGDRGLEIREVAGGYRLATKPEYHDAVRGFVKSLKPPLKLSLQALETLAVVAYKQPVTAPEISEIRGVDSGGVLGSLMARKLITTAGRKQVIGRPILYKTTKDFLLRFGLKDINELPSIEEFEKMAGELADIEPVQEEIPMSEHAEGTDATPESVTGANLEEEREATGPQSDGDSLELETVPVDGRTSEPSTVATPEGDNEFAPDQPLKPVTGKDDVLQRPPGNAPQGYKKDHD